MDTIPLDAGDLRWVFPDLTDNHKVLAVLRRAANNIQQLASHLGVRASWTGSGLEIHGNPDSGVAMLFGCAETVDVSFIVYQSLPTDPIEWRSLKPPPWLVDAEISVRCDATADCGMHEIEQLPETKHFTPLDTANALLTASAWLLDRGTTEPPSAWRERDPFSGHA